MLTWRALEGVSGKTEAPQGRSHQLVHDTMEGDVIQSCEPKSLSSAGRQRPLRTLARTSDSVVQNRAQKYWKYWCLESSEKKYTFKSK